MANGVDVWHGMVNGLDGWGGVVSILSNRSYLGWQSYCRDKIEQYARRVKEIEEDLFGFYRSDFLQELAVDENMGSAINPTAECP